MVRQLKAADSIGRPGRELHTCRRPHILVVDESATCRWNGRRDFKGRGACLQHVAAPDIQGAVHG